jgi:hypothetical protein
MQNINHCFFPYSQLPCGKPPSSSPSLSTHSAKTPATFYTHPPSTIPNFFSSQPFQPAGLSHRDLSSGPCTEISIDSNSMPLG